MQADLQAKSDKLSQRLLELGSAAVAFSGGVDSTLLLKTARHLLGSRTLAVTVQSPLFPDSELDEAVRFVRSERIEHVVIPFDPFAIAGFSQNPVNRCYLCKTELFLLIRSAAEERGIPHVIEGSHADDHSDDRPGLLALAELGILSPMRESGLTKEEIRQLSRRAGLSAWNKQSMACLASRIPFGEEISLERLAMIAAAEIFLSESGFRVVRVRCHGNGSAGYLARIETDEAGLQRLAEKNLRNDIDGRLKTLGFVYVSFDIQGYRTGSMNEVFGREAR